MASNLPARLGDRVVKQVRLIAMVCLCLPIAAYFWTDVIGLVRAISGRNFEVASHIKTIIGTIISLLSGFLAGQLVLLRNLRFHIRLDQITFQAIGKVNKLINKELIAVSDRQCPHMAAKMQSEPEKIRALFYHFANAQKELREIAFSYWESYYISELSP